MYLRRAVLGSQLAPEDLIGVPQIIDGTSRFCPPRMIARDEPYCLFLDELNACSHEVQKAFYSLIHERRIGEYYLPEASIVIGAGNRAQDSAIVKPMSSPLLNRMVHVHLKVSHRDWLDWAKNHDIHPWVIEYIQTRPDHLWSQPPKHEDPLICQRQDISVAAIDVANKQIFINPTAGLSNEECRFVMAHELLHAGLRHDTRCQGRDPYLWNVACDYVINSWLLEMGVGELPHIGVLYDPDLKNLSAESIYDQIVKNLRLIRKLSTLSAFTLYSSRSGFENQVSCSFRSISRQ